MTVVMLQPALLSSARSATSGATRPRVFLDLCLVREIWPSLMDPDGDGESQIATACRPDRTIGRFPAKWRPTLQAYCSALRQFISIAHKDPAWLAGYAYT